MVEYTVTFKHKATEQTIVRDVPGENEEDARGFAESCLGNEYEIVSFNYKREKLYCHYCGQQAFDFGFFGEPVCNECQ